MSQFSFQVPTSGSESATTFAGQCNQAWVALASMNSGASSPTNGPSGAPVVFQEWMDNSSASFPVRKIYSGSDWVSQGVLDTVQGIWEPQMGGGVQTLDTSDVAAFFYSLSENLIEITGTSLDTITSFGSGVLGQIKLCRVTGFSPLIIQDTANIDTLGGDTLYFNSGDFFQVIYLGGALSQVIALNMAPLGRTMPVGSVIWNYGLPNPPGMLRANGDTIGNVSSGADNADNKYYKLFTLLWTYGASDPDMVVSGGFGASALSDWNANKKITLPDLRGRTLFGRDNMGSVAGAAGRLTATTCNPGGNTSGATVGAETVVLVQANLPNVTLTTSIASGQGTHTHTVSNGPLQQRNSNLSVSGPGVAAPQPTTATIDNATLPAMTGTTPTGGSDTPVDKMPPGKLGTWYIVY